MTDQKNGSSWIRIPRRILWVVLGFLLGGFAASVYQKWLDQLINSTYFKLNGLSLAATIPVSLIVWTLPVVLWLIAYEMMFVKGRGIFKLYVRLLRAVSGMSIRRVMGPASLLVKMTRYAAFAYVTWALVYASSYVFLQNNMQYWRRQQQSVDIIAQAESLLKGTWYYPNQVTDDPIHFNQVSSNYRASTGLFVYPKICASFASPADPKTHYFDFGMELKDPGSPDIFRVGIDSSYSVFLAYTYDRAGTSSVNRQPLPFYSVSAAKVDLDDSQITPMCAVFTDHYVFLYANDHLIDAFPIEIPATAFISGIFYNGFTHANRAPVDLWTYGFSVGYRSREDFVDAVPTPLTTPAASPISGQ